MSWTDADAAQAEALQRDHLLALYEAGRYLDLCNAYCHEGWQYWRREDGALYESGICSYEMYEGPEELALAECAAHIKAQILAGVLGC